MENMKAVAVSLPLLLWIHAEIANSAIGGLEKSLRTMKSMKESWRTCKSKWRFYYFNLQLTVGNLHDKGKVGNEQVATCGGGGCKIDFHFLDLVME